MLDVHSSQAMHVKECLEKPLESIIILANEAIFFFIQIIQLENVEKQQRPSANIFRVCY